MSCGKTINAAKFGWYETAELYVKNHMWHYMPSSLHRVLIHVESVFRPYSVMPIGQLSKDAQESRNKGDKRCILHHARKCPRTAMNEDILQTLLYTLYPYITSLRIP